MDRREILQWLHAPDDGGLDTLWQRADELRRANVGDEVHLRGLVEISNHCTRQCGYCGLRAPNRHVERYRMSDDEIVACTHLAARLGYGTVVLQSGEDPHFTRQRVADLVRRIKAETGLAVTLSLGEQVPDTLRAWYAAGADRYLLRFETSNPTLFRHIHPPLTRAGHAGLDTEHPRLPQLRALREIGYEVGSGVMIGIPGQTWDDLANDLELFRTLDLDMIGVGPFLPHPETPLGKEAEGKKDEGTEAGGIEAVGTECDGIDAGGAADERTKDENPRGREPLNPSIPQSLNPFSVEQVPNSELMTYKVVALARLLCPRANIPSTTALATVNRESGRELGLMRGGNIVMPNLTPMEYRCKYEIYPAKACLFETAEQCHGCLSGRIRRIGRTLGTGPGISPNWTARRAAEACSRRD